MPQELITDHAIDISALVLTLGHSHPFGGVG
jgi:hypothetical protein